MRAIVDRLKGEHCRDSTRATYHRIWKIFNKFVIRLYVKPTSWEEHIVLFTGFLVESQLKSSTVKTYISAIKGVLLENSIVIDPDTFTLNTLTRACRIKNNRLITRLPIGKDLLKLLLRSINKEYSLKIGQEYLNRLYQA